MIFTLIEATGIGYNAGMILRRACPELSLNFCQELYPPVLRRMLMIFMCQFLKQWALIN